MQLHILPLSTEIIPALVSTGSVSTKAPNTQSYLDLITKQNNFSLLPSLLLRVPSLPSKQLPQYTFVCPHFL